MRRIAGPLFTVAVAAIAYGAATLSTSFSDSFLYSGATKDFVSAIVIAIERGDGDAAHAELRKFDAISIETYEGGAFLQWLQEPVRRLAPSDPKDSDNAATGGTADRTNVPKDGG